MNPRLVSVWVRGFSVLGKCPACNRVCSLIYTGENTAEGHHTYQCSICKSLVGQVTLRAECDLMDVPLEKDGFFTPCTVCPSRRTTKTEPVCIHWKGTR